MPSMSSATKACGVWLEGAEGGNCEDGMEVANDPIVKETRLGRTQLPTYGRKIGLFVGSVPLPVICQLGRARCW